MSKYMIKVILLSKYTYSLNQKNERQKEPDLNQTAKKPTIIIMMDIKKASCSSQTKKEKQKADTWSIAVADNENTALVFENRGSDDNEDVWLSCFLHCVDCAAFAIVITGVATLATMVVLTFILCMTTDGATRFLTYEIFLIVFYSYLIFGTLLCGVLACLSLF